MLCVHMCCVCVSMCVCVCAYMHACVKHIIVKLCLHTLAILNNYCNHNCPYIASRFSFFIFGHHKILWASEKLDIRQMLTTTWGSRKVSSMQYCSAVIISKSISVLQRCTENHHKQVITKQEYKIIRILPILKLVYSRTTTLVFLCKTSLC